MTEDTNKNEKKTKAEAYLDPKTGLFKEGNPGGGRPKGSLSLVSILKEELMKLTPATNEEKRTFAEEFVREILKKVFVEKDVRMMIEVMNRVDGMPKQTIGLDEDDRTTEVSITIKRPNSQESKDESESAIDTDIREELGGVPDKEA